MPIAQESKSIREQIKFMPAAATAQSGILRSSGIFQFREEEFVVENPIDDALKILVPAWPLQNTVAVNPFWNLRQQPFYRVLSHLEQVLHQSLLMPISYYREKYQSGEISSDTLAEALEGARSIWQDLPETVPDLVKIQLEGEHFSRKIKTAAEIPQISIDLPGLVTAEIGKFAAAYFDQSQALVDFPWKNLSFWHAWQNAVAVDRCMTIAGFPDFAKRAQEFADMAPEAAIQKTLSLMKIDSKVGQYLYLKRAAASVMGWGSRFCHEEWQHGLGYPTPTSAKPVQLLAVRVIYDYGIYRQFYTRNEAAFNQWSDSLNTAKTSDPAQQEIFALLYVWHLAFELSYQRNVALHLSKASTAMKNPSQFRLVFCIDVRSEMLRRHIEACNSDCHTTGFAGFFGAALDYKKCDEKAVGHRLPVLLKPSISLAEAPETCTDLAKTLTSAVVTSYFRNLRKAPLSSFLFVELFGILSVTSLLRRTLRTIYRRMRHSGVPERFSSVSSKPICADARSYADNHPLTTEEKTAYAANALTHMGLKSNFSKLNLIVGHGATTTNNAFGSALDCGACGGHAGDVNARFLAALLSDQEVRSGLVVKGISIPESSWFMAAVHETVTDEVHILDEQQVPESFREDLASLKLTLKAASKQCRLERQVARSHCLDSSPTKRGLNWSEVRPEWGLAGNACFIVAPRHRSLGVNLSSRAFLHDYDWRTDDGFKTLELIMTAPMVVTNWINMQYYGSVASPRYYGSGNKVLHNLVNETGVIEGNGGDLRVGLPIQSVHDGERFVHDPLRLSVFIEAPRIEIEKIICKHQVVSDLVSNAWLHIVQIDGDSNRISRRLGDGTYKQIA